MSLAYVKHRLRRHPSSEKYLLMSNLEGYQLWIMETRTAEPRHSKVTQYWSLSWIWVHIFPNYFCMQLFLICLKAKMCFPYLSKGSTVQIKTKIRVLKEQKENPQIIILNLAITVKVPSTILFLHNMYLICEGHGMWEFPDSQWLQPGVMWLTTVINSCQFPNRWSQPKLEL